jgi:hypothetical protein
VFSCGRQSEPQASDKPVCGNTLLDSLRLGPSWAEGTDAGLLPLGPLNSVDEFIANER